MDDTKLYEIEYNIDTHTLLYACIINWIMLTWIEKFMRRLMNGICSKFSSILLQLSLSETQYSSIVRKRR